MGTKNGVHYYKVHPVTFKHKKETIAITIPYCYCPNFAFGTYHEKKWHEQ